MKTTEPFFTAEDLNNTFGITLEHANAKVLPLQEELQRALRENEELKKGYITVGQWDALIAENERLKDANCWSCEDKEKIRKLTEQNRKQSEQITLLKEALEFYSGTVEKQVEIWDKSLLIDRGDKAREALAKCKELEK